VRCRVGRSREHCTRWQGDLHRLDDAEGYPPDGLGNTVVYPPDGLGNSVGDRPEGLGDAVDIPPG
jgi:hypothetical protein